MCAGRRFVLRECCVLADGLYWYKQTSESVDFS
jgi:hypothetical protein